ncbi:DUF2894 domain-containing protein, partial [Ideonella dechloratans]
MPRAGPATAGWRWRRWRGRPVAGPRPRLPPLLSLPLPSPTMAEPWSPEAELAALRAAGLDRADPVRFAYLQALARRLPAQPARAQALLAERLQQAAAALRAASTQHGAQAPVPAPA